MSNEIVALRVSKPELANSLVRALMGGVMSRKGWLQL
jgi:hypothetical protein